MAPLDDLIDSFLIAFKDSFNATVPVVLNPTLYSQSKSYVLSVVAEKDSLNPPFNHYPSPYLFHIDLKTITGSS